MLTVYYNCPESNYKALQIEIVVYPDDVVLSAHIFASNFSKPNILIRFRPNALVTPIKMTLRIDKILYTFYSLF